MGSSSEFLQFFVQLPMSIVDLFIFIVDILSFGCKPIVGVVKSIVGFPVSVVPPAKCVIDK